MQKQKSDSEGELLFLLESIVQHRSGQGVPAGRRDFGELQGRAHAWCCPGAVLHWQDGTEATMDVTVNRAAPRALCPAAAKDEVGEFKPTGSTGHSGPTC